MAILSTGFGKSVIFELFTLVKMQEDGDMSRNAGNGENGDFGEIWSRLLTKYFKRIN